MTRLSPPPRPPPALRMPRSIAPLGIAEDDLFGFTALRREQVEVSPRDLLGTGLASDREGGLSETSIILPRPFSRLSSSVLSCRAKPPGDQLELMFSMAAFGPVKQPPQVVAAPQSPGSWAFESSPGAAATPVDALPPRTIAELIERLRRHPTLTPRRLRDMISALRKICRLADKRLCSVPATATQIRSICADSSAAAAGISTARWSNVRSLALDALRHAGVPAIQSRTREPLSFAWDGLRDRLPDIQARAGLSRFMSYCSRRRIDPSQVTEAAFNDFAEMLRSGTLVRQPAQVFRTTCQRWNRAVTETAGWPTLIVGVPDRSRRYAFDLTAFPEQFQTDVAAFLACTGNQDPFAEDYAPSVKPATIAMRRKQIAQMATALTKTGIGIEAITRLAVLVEPANAKRILRFLRDRRGSTFTYLHQQGLLLKTIARYWVKAPQAHIETIGGFARNLAVKRRAMTPKNARRLRQFDIDQNLHALLGLPARVLAEVRRDDRGTQTDARRLMLAVAVALLTVTAMRIDNLASLEPERHFVRIGREGATRTLLIITAEEVKASKPIEAELSPAIEQLLATYQRDYLPRLAATSEGGLFLSRRGERCKANSLAVMVGRFIKREIGIEANAHLFRHLAAKLVLADDPNNIETARQLLGHGSTTTTERAYLELRTAPAYRRYETIVSGCERGRSRTGPSAPRTRTDR
jgi:integrase